MLEGSGRETIFSAQGGANCEQLKAKFHSCLRYQSAPPILKPLLNPVRFLRNQISKRGLSGRVPGVITQTEAFHMEDFSVVEGELVSQIIACYGVYEPELTAAFLELIRPGGVVVDIGMHVGYYATLFAALVGPEGEVHAFEPTPSTREIGLLNTRRFPWLRVHPLAVWSAVQTVTLRDYGPRWMAFNSLLKAKLNEEPAPPKEIAAQTITLDAFRKMLSRPISVIKIDAESAERDIIRGAHALLRQDQPLISVEVGDADGSSASRDLVMDLEALGYVPWEFAAGRFTRHQKQEVYSYNNLIFAPAGRDLSVPRES